MKRVLSAGHPFTHGLQTGKGSNSNNIQATISVAKNNAQGPSEAENDMTGSTGETALHSLPGLARHAQWLFTLLIVIGCCNKIFAQAEIQNPSFPFWKVKGNSGTTAGTNFIGTTDDESLVFKVNGQFSGMLDSLNALTAFGFKALQTGTGAQNSGFGVQVLSTNITGTQNAAFGYQALLNNTTGNNNTAIGTMALRGNTTGNENTCVGINSISSNTTGSRNTAIGCHTLRANTTGILNSAVGQDALRLNTSGTHNSAMGAFALNQIISGSNNTAIGARSADTCSAGTNLTALGSYSAFAYNLTNATAVGAYAYVAQSNTLVLGNNANVGIGTSAPTVKLEVIGKTKTNELQVATGASTGYVLTSDAAGNATWQTAPVSAPQTLSFTTPNLSISGGNSVNLSGLGYWTAIGNNIYNNNTGNVGVGTNTPGQKLEVAGNILLSGGPDVFIKRADGTASDPWGYDLTIEAGSSYWGGNPVRAGGDLILKAGDTHNIWDGVSPGNVYIQSGGNTGQRGAFSGGSDVGFIVFSTGGANSTVTERMRINDAGNVGIGTSSPGDLLTVSKNVAQTASLATIIAGDNTQGIGIGWDEIRKVGNYANSDLKISAKGTGNILLQYASSGNVGIGTSSPTELLTVSKTVAQTSSLANFIAGDLTQGVGIGYDEIRKTGATANSDLKISAKGTGDILLQYASTGNVGIGTSTPSDKFTIEGISNSAVTFTINQTGTTQYMGGKFQRNGTERWLLGMNNADDDFIIRNNASTDMMVITNTTGNVGIGTTAPTDKLAVTGTNNAVAILSINQIGTDQYMGTKLARDGSEKWLLGMNNTADYFVLRYNGTTDAFTVRNTNGFMGIGTPAPNYPLEIESTVSTSYSGYGYLAAGGSGTAPGNSGSVNVSLRTNGRIIAAEFNAVSDARIKQIIGKTNNAGDLNTLNKIQVTDYKFIDTIAKGNRLVKKVIAQELETVYPNAVSKITDVVPDIYQLAEIKKGMVYVKNDLKPGEQVQLVFADKKEIVEVVEANPFAFKTKLIYEGSVFVFGRQVTDFHTVDYEALTTLNISATQELLKRISVLEQQTGYLRSENMQIQTSLMSIEQDMVKLKASLSTQPVK